ncbi:MAG: hypothetical protein ABSA47_09900 [Verrucomicrobiota bacterium]|jgi:hypothetical protein
MVWNILISILCLAVGGLAGWLVLNPKLLRARSEAAALNAALEMAKEEIVTLQSDLEGAGKRIATLQGELETARKKLDEVEKAKRQAALAPLNREEFRTQLFGIIDAEVNRILESKRAKGAGGANQPANPSGSASPLGETKSSRVLDYADALALTSSVRGIFVETIRVVPEQVEVACLMAEAFLAPTAAERRRLIKRAAKFGGVAGISFIIAAALAAVGLAHGVIGLILAFLIGPHFPFGLALAGVTLGAVAAYFALTGNPEVDTERFLKALKGGLGEAIKKIWAEHGEKLSRWHPKVEKDACQLDAKT